MGFMNEVRWSLDQFAVQEFRKVERWRCYVTSVLKEKWGFAGWKMDEGGLGGEERAL